MSMTPGTNAFDEQTDRMRSKTKPSLCYSQSLPTDGNEYKPKLEFFVFHPEVLVKQYRD